MLSKINFRAVGESKVFRLREFRSVGCVVAAVIVCTATATLADTRKFNGQLFDDAIDQAGMQRWDSAFAHAAEINDTVALTAIEWMRLRSGVKEWQDYNDFLAMHGDWPGLKILRKSGEAAISSTDDPVAILRYFEKQPPQTGAGAIRLAEAYRRLDRPREARLAILDAWKSLPFTQEQQAEALSLFSSELRGSHAKRLDTLLWDGKFKQARVLFPLLDSETRQLANTRIALREEKSGVNSMIGKVSAKYKDDPGLAFERFIWRARNGYEESAIELLVERSVSVNSLGTPAKWASRRLRTAHALMRQKKYDLAYQVASAHFLKSGLHSGPSDWSSAAHLPGEEKKVERYFADLEWLAGYISLRFIGDPHLAAIHFERFREAVESPISNGRAGYWLGRAYQAQGKTSRAEDAYRFAAGFQTTFYGQLAAEKIGAKPKRYLAGGEVAPRWQSSPLARDPIVRVAILFEDSGRSPHAAWFLAHRAETLDRRGIATLASLARDYGAEFAAIKVAKQGLVQGDELIDFLFPLMGNEFDDLPIPAEILIAVARQETEFRERAVSPKGALGFMQLLPSTAQEVADNLGLKGNIKTLLRDRKTNILLGAHYLDERQGEFDGSNIMMIASYNAGPRRLKDWIVEIGTPQIHSGLDEIDWIEHLQFGETRNYVMRVIEAAAVYRIRMNGRSRSVGVSQYLKSSGADHS